MCYDTMTTEDKEIIEDLELDEELDEDEDSQDEWSDEDLQAEVERLRIQNAKLKAKKKKAIVKASRKAAEYDDFDKRYEAKRKQEAFEEDYPGVKYSVVKAISESEGITVEEALSYLWTAWKAIIGREVTKPKKKTDEYLEARKKRLGIA